jgi:hypothetical protein
MAVQGPADRDQRRVRARRLIVRLAAAGLVAGALGQSVAPGLAQDTMSTSSTASDPAPTTPASTLGTTTPTTGTTQTTTGAAPIDPGTYTVDPGPTVTVPSPPPPKRKRKSTTPGKPSPRCVTRTTRKRVAIRSAKENAVGQPRPRTPAPTPRCKTATHPKPKATPPKPKTNADGTPSPSNPTFSLAQPGAAQVGVPNFFIEKFRIPPFLLPIYQAAGTEYGVPWQVLAAINEIETDYGRNLSVSSAGALGWMQFMPSSWATYGVDANGDGKKDPFNPVDAIFAAGRYLRAAGADKDINKAIFAYNHADWYVQSVLLRAKLIGGMPADLVGSLTGLTEGHFPVAARATYAQSLDPRAASKPRNGNAAVPVNANAKRRSVDIYSRAGAPAVAVNDGVIRQVGASKRLGRYVVLEDVYGNQYTYAHLGRVAGSYPAPKPVQPTASKLRTELEMPPRDPAPGSAASAGRQQRATPTRRRATTSAAPVTAAPAKERLFAHPSRSNAYRAGGDQQLLGTGAPVAGYATYDDYISKVLGLRRSEVVFKALKPGARVLAGTILGRIDRTDKRLAPHVTFSIKPAGRGAPQIDPKPILDGWKLLEATAIYRASGKNPFWGRDAKNPSIGQILLLSKPQLEQRVLADPRITIYDCGRSDIRSHLIDRRPLALLEFLAASGLKPYVSTLKCGHSYYVAGGGAVSEHTYGDAVDIAMINGIPMSGHQGPGSITDITVRRILTLQGTMQPNQVITLMNYPGVPYAWAQGDHADHIHVGFQPLAGDSAKLTQHYNSVLKPGQWVKLIERLNQIDNPIVPTKPSRYSLKAR